MISKSPLYLAAACTLSLVGLSGCTTSFRADVARFHQQLPPPAQGQSFTVMPDDPRLAGSLEFGHYADLVAGRLSQLGYVRAADPAAAQLVVRLDYGIDKGTQQVRASGFPSYYRGGFYGGWGGGWGGWGPAYYRGWRGRYTMGWYDPWLWGPDYDDIDTYVVYQSQLHMKIDKADGARVFEGTSKARSISSKMTYLVPNLIDALFTGFPGKDGEEIKVTVAPEPKGGQ